MHITLTLSFLATTLLLPVDTLRLTKPVQDSHPVFYTAAMLDYGKRNLIKVWMKSLRQLGGFKGPVIIITDNVRCVAAALEAIDPGDETIIDKFHHKRNEYISLGNRTFIVESRQFSFDITGDLAKTQKQQVWDYITLLPIVAPTSAIWLDLDIVVGKSLNTFLDHVAHLEKAKPNEFYEPKNLQQGNLTLVPNIALVEDHLPGEVHTGMMVVFPHQTARVCMNAWRKTLLCVDAFGPFMGPLLCRDAWNATLIKPLPTPNATAELDAGKVSGDDQKALWNTAECKKKGGIHIMDRKELLKFPTEDYINAALHGSKKGAIREFTHFTFTGRMWTIRTRRILQFYYDVLHLPRDMDPFGRCKF
eukprot:gnl/TRDRNA2_/TRDRNA2_27806_c0_seq1.p1 gnl/TRDRNA2_/TRDRNA2_27806_c0~~gnl/TRDRNA2_/TRDRNA2_27806_c0_seq1.p1  ORF type:complete len:362 (+),score=23.01 gnl/TRDRNA2_/TRDRNA2_27806_c0_seq1:31-1116(+)